MNKEYTKLSKNALKCLYVSTAITHIFLMALISAGWLFLSDKDWASVIAVILIIICVINAAISPFVRFNRYRYHIDEECIDIKEGFIFVERNIVPIERLHKLTVTRGPIDKMFGLGKVLVTTAGGDVTIRFLEINTADQIADTLQKRINTIVSKQRENQ